MLESQWWGCLRPSQREVREHLADGRHERDSVTREVCAGDDGYEAVEGDTESGVVVEVQLMSMAVLVSAPGTIAERPRPAARAGSRLP